MRGLLAGTAALAVLVSISGGALAATVQNIQGSVLVNKGSGFQRVTGPASVAAGARVMANTGGSATIVYDNGCTEQVEPGAIVTVKQDGTCQSSIMPYVIGAAVVGGGAALVIGLSNDDKPASP